MDIPVEIKKNELLITNIQRFSIHDGPGIRTTIFLKGCNLRCPWCSNPENIEGYPQKFLKDGKKGTYGKWYDIDALIKECLKDKAYYSNGMLSRDKWIINSAELLEKLPGGVTLSGGEPLLHVKELIPVVEALHNECIHIAVETALFISENQLRPAVDCIDLFYVDIKILNREKAKQVENGDLELYLNNLNILALSGKPFIFRVPVISKYTADTDNRGLVRELIRKYSDSVLKVELIKGHNLAKSKYISLGQSIEFSEVSDELMNEYRDELSKTGVEVEICKI